MSRYLFFIGLFFGVWVNIKAQTPTIRVYGSAINTPLYGAHVIITSSDGKKSYAITNIKGETSNPITTGYAVVSIAHLGYENFQDTIFAGESKEYILKESLISLDGFVVTSHAVPTRIEESILKIRVITQQQIQSQGAVNLRDLLSQQLNIRVTQDAALGSGIRMQGIGGENVKIMIDGVPVIGRLDGNIDLSQILLNNIERIEIIEGSSSVIYGSNALAGVINLITKKNANHLVEGTLNGYYETVGQYNIDGQMGFQFGKNNLQISGGRNFFDGFSVTDTVKRYLQWKPKEQYFTELQYNRGIGKMNIRYASNFLHEMLESKGILEAPFFITATDQYLRTIRTQQSLFLTGFIKNNHHLDITVSYSYYNRRRQSFKKDLVTLEKNLFDENMDVFQTWMSRGVYNYRKDGSRIAVQAGYESTTETAEGLRIVNQFQWMTDISFFTSVDFILLKKLVIKPSIRYGYNSRFTMPVIPSIHIKYTPIKGLDIRASYSRGFRAPSLKELFFEFVDANHNVHGNPLLHAEHSNHVGLTIGYEGSKNKVDFGFSAHGFYNLINDQIRNVEISISSDSNVYRNENISRFQSVGVQLQAQTGYKNFNTGIGFSYTGIVNGIYDDAMGNNTFSFYPEIQGNASYNFKKWGGLFTVFVKYSGKQPVLYTEYDIDLQKDVIKEGAIEGFTLLDISYIQSFLKKRLQIGLYGKNLLNVTNIQQTAGISTSGAHSAGSSSLPTQWGATFAISVKYNFIIHQ